MKKLLLSLLAFMATSAWAAEHSIYAWGPWSEGIKPAAGPVYVAPVPVSEPQVDLRESMALLREYNSIQPPLQTGVQVANTAIPIATAPPSIVIVTPPPPGI